MDAQVGIEPVEINSPLMDFTDSQPPPLKRFRVLCGPSTSPPTPSSPLSVEQQSTSKLTPPPIPTITITRMDKSIKMKKLVVSPNEENGDNSGGEFELKLVQKFRKYMKWKLRKTEDKSLRLNAKINVLQLELTNLQTEWDKLIEDKKKCDMEISYLCSALDQS